MSDFAKLFSRVKHQVVNTYQTIIIDYHLKRIRRLSLEELLNDPMARMIFSEYLILRNSITETEILFHWKCYEICKKIQRRPRLILETKVFQSLIHNCPSSLWEQELWGMTYTYEIKEDNEYLCKTLEGLKRCCIKNMISHTNYNKFITDLHFRKWRMIELISDVYNNTKYKHYEPYFLDIEEEPRFIV